MSEIKSSVEIVEGYVSTIKAANEKLASDSLAITEDGETTLKVNSNGTTLNASAKGAIVSLSAQISADCGRLSSIATLFEEKDQSLAGGH